MLVNRREDSTPIQGILAVGGGCGLNNPLDSPTPEDLFLVITFLVDKHKGSSNLLSKSLYQGNCGWSYVFDGF